MSISYKLEPYDINKLKRKEKRKAPHKYARRDVVSIIEEFMVSGYDCCRVCFCENDRKAHFECTILRRSVKTNGYDNSVKVVLRGEGVYLVKKDKWEEKK